jgi:arylsulfatase A-like enzyme
MRPAEFARAAGRAGWQRCRLVLIGLAALLAPSAAPLTSAGQAAHVVVMVWDGLRPDAVTEQDTPTLHRLARDGVFFQNHHAVYVSSTQVNGVALATGAYPSRNGILANREYRPALDALRPVRTESLAVVRQADRLTGGGYVRLPTLAEILRRQGLSTAVAGTKPVALLHDRAERPDADPCCINLFAGESLPERAAATLADALGPYPAPDAPNTKQDAWTTEALTQHLWRDGVPRYSLLWLSEPDRTQHLHGPGSPEARAALRGADQNLARVLAALEQKRARDNTNLFVVSDHGFSSIVRREDVAETLRTAGFNALREFNEPPAAGDILVVGLGGSTAFYVVGRQERTVRRLVEFLQQQEFVGVIFTREQMPGTFTLDQARLDTPEAPDVLMSLRWAAGKNAHGLPGELIVDGAGGAGGGGHHGSLSAFDMRATLVAAGPDLRRGMVNELPSGNADLAPTILWLLGVQPPQPMDGRILSEALPAAAPAAFPPIQTRTLEAHFESDQIVRQQFLRVITFGAAVYFSEGNGAVGRKP